MLRAIKDFFIIVCVIVLALAALAVYAHLGNSASPGTDNSASAEPVTSATATPVDFSDPDHYEKNQGVPEAACNKSLACMADKHLGWAETSCKQAAESQSRYQVKWTDDMFHPLFGEPVAHWQSPTDHEVAYVGNRMEMQNQFGAFERMNYRCVWDARAEKVVSIELQPAS